MDMTNFNENWSRLESVIVWAGMSVNGFAHYIGLSRAENLYQIKSGKNGISRNLVNRIVESFPQSSAAWLLMGEGSMLLSEDKGGQGVPFYDGSRIDDYPIFIFKCSQKFFHRVLIIFCPTH